MGLSGSGCRARGAILCVRAQASEFLGEIDAAQKDYDEAIRTSPIDANLYRNRALYWQRRKRPDLAAADMRKFEELRQGR